VSAGAGLTFGNGTLFSREKSVSAFTEGVKHEVVGRPKRREMHAVAAMTLALASTALHFRPVGTPTSQQSRRSFFHGERLGAPPRLVVPVGSRDESAVAASALDEPPRAAAAAPAAPLAPLVVLSLVPLAWGTYGPAIKSLYSLEAPPPELLFNWMNYVVSAATLVVVSLVRAQLEAPSNPSASLAGDSSSSASASGASDGADGSDVSDSPRSAMLAGAELGGYLFLGSTMQIFGLRYTSAGRAAFLVQLTTVIVPLLDALLVTKQLPRPRVLGACLLAFSGVLLLTAGGGGGEGEGAAAVAALAGGFGGPSLGDGLVGAAALIYSMHVVRLSYHAPRLNPLRLARAKEVSRLGYASATLAVGVALSSQQADALGAFVASFGDAPDAARLALGIVLWNGVVTTAFPTWAQSFGQARVSAGTAQVLYSLQPLWSSLFGFLLLGETFSAAGGAGAALILAAVLLAGTDAGAGESTQLGVSVTTDAALVDADVDGAGAVKGGAGLVVPVAAALPGKEEEPTGKPSR